MSDHPVIADGAALVLREIARWGAYFPVVLHRVGTVRPEATAEPPEGESVAAILSPQALAARIEATLTGVAPGRDPAQITQIPRRIGASVAHLGLMSRLVSGRIGAAALGVLLPTRLEHDRLIPTGRGGSTLSVALPDGTPALKRLAPTWLDLAPQVRDRWVRDLLGDVAEPVRAAFGAVTRVPPTIATGNLVSSIHGGLAAVAWTRGGGRADPGHEACVADVLGRPEFASAWRGRLAVGTDIAVGTDTAVGTDGPFRRASCCLLYRVAAPGEPAPMCGDCILR